MLCEVTILKVVAIFLKNAYEGIYQKDLFNKTNAFSKHLEQLLTNKRNIWWSCSRLSVCFFKVIILYIFRNSSSSSDCFYGFYASMLLCFFFFVNIEKIKNKFLGFIKSTKHRSTDPPTNRPMTTDLTSRWTHWINNHIWKPWQ